MTEHALEICKNTVAMALVSGDGPREAIMMQLGGESSRVSAPNRGVIFNAAGSGTLNSFDMTASGEPVKFSPVACKRL